MLSRVAVFFLLEGWWKTLKLHVCPTASNLRWLGHLMNQNTVSPKWGGSQKSSPYLGSRCNQFSFSSEHYPGYITRRWTFWKEVPNRSLKPNAHRRDCWVSRCWQMVDFYLGETHSRLRVFKNGTPPRDIPGDFYPSAYHFRSHQLTVFPSEAGSWGYKLLRGKQ